MAEAILWHDNLRDISTSNVAVIYWDLDSFYTGATSNAKIIQSVHNAAKNIILRS